MFEVFGLTNPVWVEPSLQPASLKNGNRGMSALPPTADIGQIGRDVGFVPERQWRKEKAAPQGHSSIKSDDRG
jgi:hypothetical protein